MSQIALPLDTCPHALSPLPEAGSRADSPGATLPAALPGNGGPSTLAPQSWACAGFEAVGHRIGLDHARYQTTPPADHLHAGHPVRQGWDAGRAAFAGRALAPTRAVRLWLELRLQAWLRGRAFDELWVTPRFVARIDARICPVTQRVLTHSPAGAECPTDAVVMPLFEGAACAVGNLAVVSRLVAQARAALSQQEMAQIVCRLASPELALPTPAAGGKAPGPTRHAVAPERGAVPLAAADTVAGLDVTAWRRLAALTSLATLLAHEPAAVQPLHVLPPPQVRLLNPVQALQTLLTLVFTGPGYARQLTDLGAFMPHAQARRAYFLFMNAMLARRLSARGAVPPAQVRTAMEQAWSHPLVQQRWQALAQMLTPVQAERVVRLVAQRRAGATGPTAAAAALGALRAPGGGGTVGAKGPVWRWMDEAAATEGWALETQGAAAGAGWSGLVSAAAGGLVSGPARSRPPLPPAGALAPRGAAGRPTAAPAALPLRRPACGTA